MCSSTDSKKTPATRPKYSTDERAERLKEVNEGKMLYVRRNDVIRLKLEETTGCVRS